MVGATQRGNQRFYDTHSLTGWSEARATYNALKVARGKRGQVISRYPILSFLKVKRFLDQLMCHPDAMVATG
jgi:hypothetical protein